METYLSPRSCTLHPSPLVTSFWCHTCLKWQAWMSRRPSPALASSPGGTSSALSAQYESFTSSTLLYGSSLNTLYTLPLNTSSNLRKVGVGQECLVSKMLRPGMFGPQQQSFFTPHGYEHPGMNRMGMDTLV